ncbi:Nif11-like leader peptide family natural product precursor [Corallococcus sicarius]|uniref:Nif11 family protein n=1 Tax=Corallococcus sicarius TaxID=2316726 RepID=A0A3A8NJK9_9BACT|nr:Nif11-like leader peptide family natural product precursor [Corallococcus sicarius]RKH41375.1 Nif11 family protein [Corallococcus sicarius]
MSRQGVLKFFQACVEDEGLLRRFNPKSLPELLLHARSSGFEFTRDELANVIGVMEAHTITERLHEEVNASSSLWPRMWGKPRLQYVIDELYLPFSEAERARFSAGAR